MQTPLSKNKMSVPRDNEKAKIPRTDTFSRFEDMAKQLQDMDIPRATTQAGDWFGIPGATEREEWAGRIEQLINLLERAPTREERDEWLSAIQRNSIPCPEERQRWFEMVQGGIEVTNHGFGRLAGAMHGVGALRDPLNSIKNSVSLDWMKPRGQGGLDTDLDVIIVAIVLTGSMITNRNQSIPRMIGELAAMGYLCSRLNQDQASTLASMLPIVINQAIKGLFSGIQRIWFPDVKQGEENAEILDAVYWHKKNLYVYNVPVSVHEKYASFKSKKAAQQFLNEIFPIYLDSYERIQARDSENGKTLKLAELISDHKYSVSVDTLKFAQAYQEDFLLADDLRFSRKLAKMDRVNKKFFAEENGLFESKSDRKEYFEDVNGLDYSKLDPYDSADEASLPKATSQMNLSLEDFDVEDAVGGLAEVLCAVFGAYSLSNSKAKNGICRELNDLFRAKKNVSDLLGSIRAFFGRMAHHFYLGGYGFLGGLRNSTGQTGLDLFITDFQEQFDKYRAGKLHLGPETLKDFYNLKGRGEALYVTLGGKNMNPNASRLLEKYLASCDKVIQQFHDNKIDLSGARVEPVSVIIRGLPHQYKTVVNRFLSLDCARMALLEELHEDLINNHERYIYHRMVEQEYWDGYRETMPVTVFDDIAQIRDMIGDADGEAMNIIRCVNSAPFFLHMSDLASKGKVAFRSHFILGTTNMERIKPQSIACHGAFERRFHFNLKMEPKPQYAQDANKLFLDLAKIPSKDGVLGDITPDCFDFIIVDPARYEDGAPPSAFSEERLSYDELLVRIRAKYRRQLDIYSNNKALFREHTEKHPVAHEQSDPDNVLIQPISKGRLEASSQMGGTDVAAIIASLPGIKRRSTSDVYNEFNEKLLGDYYNEYDEALKKLWHSHIRNPLSVIHGLLRHNPQRENFVAYPPSFVIMQLFFYDPTNFGMFLDGDVRASHFFNRFELQFPLLETKEENLLEIRDTETFVRKIREHLGRLRFPSLNSSMKYLAIGVTGFLIIKGITALFRKTFPDEEDEAGFLAESEVFGPSAVSQGNYFKGKAKVKPKVITRARMTQQMGDQGWSTDFQKKLGLNHSFSFYVTNSTGGKTPWGYLFGIDGNLFACPAHYLMRIKKMVEDKPMVAFEKIIISQRDKQQNLDVTAIGVQEFLEANIAGDELLKRDCALLLLRNLVRTRSVIKHLISESEASKLSGVFQVGWHNPDTHEYRETSAYMAPGPIDADGNYAVFDCLVYNAPTLRGWCGLPTTVRAGTGNSVKVVGMHIAKLNNTQKSAICNVVTRELVEKELKRYLEEHPDDSEYVTFQPHKMVAEFQGDEFAINSRFERTGTVKISHSPYGSTRIVPSPLQTHPELKGLVPVKQGVAFRLKTDDRDPFEVALEKYAINEMDHMFIMERIRALDDLFHHLRNFKNFPLDKRLVSLEEALWGIEGEPTWDAINSSSSPGWPLVRTSTLKSRLFAEGAPRNKSNPSFGEISDLVIEIVKAAKDGIRLGHYFTDNLKDERYPIEKIKKGKVRLFTGSPFAYLVTCRMYFGAFASWIIANRVNNGMCIGINEKSAEWSVIAEELLFKNPKGLVGAGDYSGYDGSEKPEIHWAILDFINEWYDDGPVNARIRRILWYEVVNSQHVVGDVTYEWKASLPSGHPMTIIINCLYNLIAFRFVYFRIFGVNTMPFAKRVKLFVLGDDNIWAVDPTIAERMNEITVPKHMAEFGLVYTTETKQDTVEDPFRKLSEVEFLKRRFKFSHHLGFWLCPLRWDVITEMTNWTKKGEKEMEIWISNCENALMEASLHSKEKYRNFQLLVDKVFTFLGIGDDSLNFPLWEPQIDRRLRIYGEPSVVSEQVRGSIPKAHKVPEDVTTVGKLSNDECDL